MRPLFNTHIGTSLGFSGGAAPGAAAAPSSVGAAAPTAALGSEANAAEGAVLSEALSAVDPLLARKRHRRLVRGEAKSPAKAPSHSELAAAEGNGEVEAVTMTGPTPNAASPQEKPRSFVLGKHVGAPASEAVTGSEDEAGGEPARRVGETVAAEAGPSPRTSAEGADARRPLRRKRRQVLLDDNNEDDCQATASSGQGRGPSLQRSSPNGLPTAVAAMEEDQAAIPAANTALVDGAVAAGGLASSEDAGHDGSDAASSDSEAEDAAEERLMEGARALAAGGKTKAKAKGGADGAAATAARLTSFDPTAAASWQPGEPVPFLALARAFEEVAKESGRLAIGEIMCKLFLAVMATTPADLLAVVYLAANKVAPSHEGVELGIGDATIVKALADATLRRETQIKAEYKECGDLGLVARASRTTQRTMFPAPPLACAKVLEAFRFIAKEAGKESVDKKRARMKQLIVAARDVEPLFIVRLLQGKMRIGLAEQTVLAALAQAAVLAERPPPSTAELPARLEEAVRIMKQVFSVLPNYDIVVPALLEPGGIRALPERCRFTPGTPVGPMLAKPTRGISEVLDKFQNSVFTCEYKYDGERAQIHCLEDDSIEIYSRNAERNTQKYPDIVATMKRYKKEGITSFVLDCEAVAYDREQKRILPFQVLSTRAKKGVVVGDIKVQVCIFAFDLLYINGRELLHEQLADRRKALYESFQEVEGEFLFATAITASDVEEIQSFLNEAVKQSCEGLMVKTLEHDATYEPAKRSNNWLKLKKDYMDNLGDSLDLVVIGAFHGRGKRAGVFGAFLLACYDDTSEEYQSITKIGTGFSEAILEELSASLKQHVIPRPPPYYRYGETLPVDVWFLPSQVWEVKAADLSISPMHKAACGAVDPVKGIALRFPRFLRVREDKQPEQATSAEQVAELYRAQGVHRQADANGEGNE
eukprot:SM000189S04082  [mRNA]  locus=s189:128024:134034:+ [translate_table: standard]